MTTFTFEDYQKHKFQYQEDGEILLLERKHACLYYEPGKGKTYPAISALRQVCSENDNVLILSTADSIRNMWRIDIIPQNILPKNTILMTFNAAIVDSTKARLTKIKWKAIIVDECHKVKANGTKTSKLVYQLTRHTEYVFGLSGTPRGNVDLDIFCQFHNLNISEWGTISYTKFVETCCDVEKKFGPYGVYNNVLGINRRYIAGWERNLAMYTQRVKYDDDEMPKLNINKIVVPYVRSKEYDDASKGILRVDENASTLAKLAAIGKMHQACNGFLYTVDENGSQTTYRFEDNQKIEKLKSLVNNMFPVVIVYRHKEDLHVLQELYTTATEDIGEFKSGKSVILLLQCGRCESFNLQMCSHMIFFTMDYSFIKFKQMLHRIWRLGQEEQTVIDVLILENTIEEKIYNAVIEKKTMHELFMSARGE